VRRLGRTSKITKEEIKLAEIRYVKKGKVARIDSITIEMLKAKVRRIVRY